jgi:hypothetical protein
MWTYKCTHYGKNLEARERATFPIPAGADCTPVLNFHAAAAAPLIWSWLPDNWCAVTQTISRLIEN